MRCVGLLVRLVNECRGRRGGAEAFGGIRQVLGLNMPVFYLLQRKTWVKIKAMGMPPELSEKLCYHCGSSDIRKQGTQKGRKRYICRACGRGSLENPRYKRAEYWGKRSGARCYHCGSIETIKAGKDKGKKRFKCRDCGKFFRENPILPSGNWDPRKRKKYDLPTAGQLILELQSLAQGVLKKTPTTDEINQLSKQGLSHSLATYYAVFGSYVTAVRRARLKQHYLQQFDETDRARMRQELRSLSDRLKRPLIAIDVRKAAVPEGQTRRRLPSGRYNDRPVSPVNHYQAAFGSIPRAIAAAGVAPNTFTRREMIEILRKLDVKLDRPVQAADIDEYYLKGKGPSHRSFVREFGSIAGARRAAGVQERYRKAGGKTPYWQKYTQEELIAQLKALGEKLGRKPVLQDINRASKERECASHTVFKSMFGSLSAAYLAAGFTERKRSENRYTDREILDAIRKLTGELGRWPGYTDFLAASKAGKCPAPGTIARRLGRLSELRAEEGFEVPRYLRRLTDDQLIADLRRFAEGLGRFPTYGELYAGSSEGKCPSPGTLCRRLGKLADIYKAHFSDLKGRKFFTKYTDEGMLDSLRNLIDELGRFPTYSELVRACRAGKSPSPAAFRDRFGTLEEVRQKFFPGVSTIAKPARYTDEELIAAVKRVADKLGRFPKMQELEAASRAGNGIDPTTIVKRFGSMGEIHRRFFPHLEARKLIRDYTREQVLEALRRFVRETGRFPQHRELNEGSRAGKYPCPETVTKRLGPLTEVRRKYFPDIKVLDNKTYSEEEIVEGIRNLAQELGRFPTSDDIDAASKAGTCSSQNTIRRRFGTLDAFRRRFFPRVRTEPRRKPPKKYRDEQMIEDLRQLVKELGRFPTDLELRAGNKSGKCAGPTALRTRFGGMRELRRRHFPEFE